MAESKPSAKWFIETQSGWFVQNGIPEWFHGVITRKDAEDLLRDTTIGCFLIRVSESRIGYSLSYRCLDRYRHFMIDVFKDQECLLAGDTRIHSTLEDLVNFHTQQPIYPFNELLTQPCGQKTISSTDYEELFEDRLTLPTPIHHNPEQSSMGTAMPTPLSVETHTPPLPTRRLQTSTSFNSQTRTSPYNPAAGNRLYPLLPTQVQMVPVAPSKNRFITKSQSLDVPPRHATDNLHRVTRNAEKLGNSSKKPLKACKTAMNKAVSFMKEGELAQDLKKMENAMTTHMKSVKDSFGRFGPTGQKNSSSTPQQRYRHPSVPEEYTAPPPFAPGFS